MYSFLYCWCLDYEYDLKCIAVSLIGLGFQVLFKNLGVDLKDVTPTSLLKDRVREVEGNPDFSNKDVGSAQQPMVGEVKPSIIPPLNQVELPLEVTGPAHPGGHSRALSQVGVPSKIF